MPAEGCECGIYGFTDVTTLQSQYRQAHGIIAVIALEGAALEGTHGYRAQAARVLALWTAPDLIHDALRDKIAASLDDVVFYDDLDTMVADFPGLRRTPTTDPPRTITPADVCVSSSLPRRQFSRALATIVKWWLRVLLWVIAFCWWPVWDYFATSSNFDISDYPVVGAIMAIPRWISQFAIALGGPVAMWFGCLPAAIVGALYTFPAARRFASRLVAPAEGMLQVTVAATITAALVDAASVARSPMSWIAAAVLSVLAVTVRPISSARRLWIRG
ncbi:hypothetical protein ACWF9G_22655 [Nocardia sp. NPDC055029]